MKEIRIYIILVLLLSCFSVLKSQVRYGQPDVECFNRRQYGGGMQSWSISQADNGLLYFANNDGLLEYDGTFWHLYKAATEHIVRSVLCVGERVYIGQYHRVGFFLRENDRPLSYHSISIPDSLSLMEDVWALCEYDDKIFALSQQAILEIENDVVTKVHLTDNSHFLGMYVVDGDLLVCDVEKGLLLYVNGKFRELVEARELRGQYITFAVPLAGVGVVIGTRTSGLWVMKNGEVSRWMVSANNYAISNELFCGAKVQDTKIALGTIRGGVAIVGSNGEIETIVERKTGLDNNTVLSVAEDMDGNLWAGLDNGIAKLALGDDVSLIQKAYNIGSGYAVANLGDSYYFGTNQGLFKIDKVDLMRADKAHEDFKIVTGLVGQVWGLMRIGNSLFCAHDKGAFVITENAQPRRLTPDSERGVWGFCQINDTTVFCNSYYGIMRLEYRYGRWEWAGRMKGFDEGALYMAKEGNNVLWVTYGNEAIYRLTLSVDHSRIVSVDNLTNTFFSYDDKIEASRVGDRVYFTSKRGVFVYDERHSSFVKVESIDKCFEGKAKPSKLIEDGMGKLWYFCDGEVGYLMASSDGGEYERVRKPFVSLYGCFVSGREMVYSVDSENSFIAIEDGFAHYIAGKNVSMPINRDIYVRRLMTIGTDSVYEILDSKSDRVIEVDYKYNNLLVEYSVCRFGHEPIEFSTMLEGYDEGWTSWNVSPVRELGNIREGEYTLRIKSRNISGEESEQMQVSILVYPPFYRSLLMKVVYFVVMVLFVILSVWVLKRRERLVKMKQMEKEREDMEKEKERLRVQAVEQEAEIVKLRNRNLEEDKRQKEKELTNQAFQLAKVNELLSDIKQTLVDLRRKKDKMTVGTMTEGVQAVIKKIQFGLDDVSRMQLFEVHFENVHKEFFMKLTQMCPSLNRNELKICAFIRMGMSSKEIASVLQITVHSVENTRSLIRQKLGLGKENMREYMQSICGVVSDGDKEALLSDK